MGFKPEPILDVARGISAFTAAYVLGNQVLIAMRELFVDRCTHCKGAGRVICQHCGGTKTQRSRPGEFQRTQADIVDHRSSDLYQCVHCGPTTVFDFSTEIEDKTDEAFIIMDNVKAAYAGKPRKKPVPILAGTVPCPICHNKPRVRRHTPNFARVFKLEEPWWWGASCEAGTFRGTNPIRKREYIEYPSRRPHALDLDPAYLVETMKAEHDANVVDAELSAAESDDEAMAAKAKKEAEDEAKAAAAGKPLKPEVTPRFVDDSDSEVSDVDD